jgi:hypothetical protein
MPILKTAAAFRHAACLNRDSHRVGRVDGRTRRQIVPACLIGDLATDLARYGSNAEWRGVYYRGDKIGFTVSQTFRPATGSSCRRTDGCRCRCSAHDRAAHSHIARVDSNFGLRSFEFSLDPGTGAVVVRGRVDPMPDGGDGARLVIGITSGGSTGRNERDLPTYRSSR